MIKSVRFDIPTIAIGNLSVGGAGKTPHVEYLIELLQPYINIATLSRGYKRETTGFLAVEAENSALQVGDEPLQYKRKYQNERFLSFSFDIKNCVYLFQYHTIWIKEKGKF